MVPPIEMSGFASHGGQRYPPVFPWYIFGTPQGAPTTTDVVVSHSPLDANFISQCHSLGLRCLPYITFASAPPTVSIPSDMNPPLPPLPPLTSSTYMGVQFSNIWWEKRIDGAITTESFPPHNADGVGIFMGSAPGGTGVPVPCCNTRSYHAAMLKWIDLIMGLGADGVFIDVVQLRQACYGDVRNAGNPMPHHHRYTPRSRIPRLNPSDPTNPFANWIAQAQASGSQTLAQAQEDAARQGAQNWAYAQLLRQVRARVRHHKPDGAVLGNVGFPNFPGQWMQWFQPYLDASVIENFITFPSDGTGVIVREQHFGGILNGFYNLTPVGQNKALSQPPGTPTDPPTVPWPTMVSRDLPAFVNSGHKLVMLSTISNITMTPQNTSPSSTFDVPAREDAFLAYAASQLAGGVSWTGPVFSASFHNPNTDFGDLHQIALGSPIGSLVELDSSGNIQTGSSPAPPVVTVGVFGHGVVVVNWSNQPTAVTFSQLQTIVNAAVTAGQTFPLPSLLYDLFNKVSIAPATNPTGPIAPGATPGNPNLPSQGRIYLLEPQPAFGSASIGQPALEPVPGASNATSFGPSAPSLGKPFLYNWVSNDAFGTRFLTGSKGTKPFPWIG